MEMRRTGLVNLGADSSKVAQASRNTTSVDTTKLFNVVTNAIQNKLKTDEDIAAMKLKSESDRIHQKYRLMLSDKELHRDTEKLKQVQDEYAKARQQLDIQVADTMLTEKTRVGINEYNKTSYENVNAYYNLQVKEQKFNEQQAEINARLYELNDRALSSAYEGLAGWQQMETSFIEYDKLLQSQVDSKVLDEVKAKQMLTSSLANATVIATVNGLKTGIVDSNLSYEQKLEKLNNIKKQFQDPRFLKKLAKEGSKSYTNTTFESLNIELNQRSNVALNLINQDLARLNVNESIRKAKNKRQDNLNLNEDLVYRGLQSSGDAYGAYRYLTTKTGQVPKYNDQISFFIDNGEQLFGIKPEDWANPDNTNVPMWKPQEATYNVIAGLMTNPKAILRITGEVTESELLDNVMEATFEVVGNEIGLTPDTPENRTAIAKFVAGSGMAGGLFPNGFDYNMTMKYADPNNVKMSEKQFEHNKQTLMNQAPLRELSGSSEFIYNSPSKTNSEKNKRNIEIQNLANKGIALPKTIIDKKENENLFSSRSVLGFQFSSSPTSDSLTRTTISNTIQEYFNEHQLSKGKGNIKMIETQSVIADYISREQNLLGIQNRAMVYFNKDNSQQIKNGMYLDGVGKSDLNNDKYWGRALKEVVEEQLDLMYNNTSGRIGGNTPNYKKAKIIKIDN